MNHHGRSRLARLRPVFRPSPEEIFRPRLIGAAGELDRTTAGTTTMRIDAEQRAMLARMARAHAGPSAILPSSDGKSPRAPRA
ncbi:hypothetical protein NB311A_08979 [Nitrobacter sp. Nb-311A]|nr:hypothetical protein NB311A_08979 [Nitrobacter sp. Nb-311A]